MAGFLTGLLSGLGAAARGLGGVGARAATGMPLGVGPSIIGRALIDAASTAQNPAARQAAYMANAASTNVKPPPDECIRLWYANRLTADGLHWLLAYHGISWRQSPASNYGPQAWRDIVDLARPTFPPELYLHWVRQGRLDPSRLDDELQRAGYYRRADRDLILSSWENLTEAQIIAMVLRGLIGPDDGVTLLTRLGYRNADARLIMGTRLQALPVGDLLALWNRGKLRTVDMLSELRVHGLDTQEMVTRLDELRKPIPPPTDLIMFGVKEVWDENVVARFGYDTEFPAAFAAWMEKHGLNWSEELTGPDGAAIPAVPWPRAYWRGHWRPASPTEAYEWLHRFRPDPSNPAMSVVPGVPPFTRTDLDAVLKINDFAPGFRRWLEAASYRVPRLVDIRRAYSLGVITPAQAVGYWQDGGQTEANANMLLRLADATEREKERVKMRRRQDRLKERLAARILSGMKSGWMPETTVRDTLQGMGWDGTSIDLSVAEVKYALAEDTVKAGLKRAQSDYFSGRDTLDGIRRRFVLLGVNNEFGEQIIQRWVNMRGEGRVLLSASRAIDMLKRGLLSLDAVVSRLVNLGWAEFDARLLILAAEQDIAKLQAKASAAEEKSRRATAKEFERLLRESQQQTAKMQADLRRLSPVSAVNRWYAQREVERDWYYERMAAMGYPLDAIDLHFSDAERAREEEDEREEQEEGETSATAEET